MAFLVSPNDGDRYTNAIGTLYEYDAAEDKWFVVADSAQTLDNAFDKGKEIDGANSEAKALVVGGGTETIKIWDDATDIIMKGSSAILLKTNADDDDYLKISTASNIPKIEAIGDTRLYLDGKYCGFLTGGTLRILVYDTIMYPNDVNAMDLGSTVRPWKTIYYHALSDETCASFKQYDLENLIALLDWEEEQNLYHHSPNSKKHFPHIDMSSISDEFAMYYEGKDEDGNEIIEYEKTGLLQLVDGEYKEATKTIRKGDKSGIDMGSTVYALKDTIVKMYDYIKELETRIQKLESG